MFAREFIRACRAKSNSNNSTMTERSNPCIRLRDFLKVLTDFQKVLADFMN